MNRPNRAEKVVSLVGFRPLDEYLEEFLSNVKAKAEAPAQVPVSVAVVSPEKTKNQDLENLTKLVDIYQVLVSWHRS